MKHKLTVLSLAIFLAACGRQQSGPAQVLNFGLHTDSPTGAMMVSTGDTLYSISQRYRLSMRDIIEMNGLNPPYTLAVGQRLKLPAPLEYRVRDGDTLHSIAHMFGMDGNTYQLAQINRLQAPYRIMPGQELRIPSRYGEVEKKAAVTVAQKAPARRVEKVDREEVALLKSPRPKPVIEKSRLPPTTLLGSKRPDFTWPVRGKIISSYGPKEGGLYNKGINIAAPRNAPVVAAADGVVAYAGSGLKSYGNLVLIRHSGGMMTAYAHLSSIDIQKGATVKKGQPIGKIGSSGSVGVSQLHFEVRKGAKAYDPAEYLG